MLWSIEIDFSFPKKPLTTWWPTSRCRRECTCQFLWKQIVVCNGSLGKEVDQPKRKIAHLLSLKEFMDKIMFGAPVDLSFKSLSRLIDAWSETPCSRLRPLKKNSEGKYLSCSLRLSNNSIGDLYDLHQTVSHFLAQPSHLAWLDLSFNKLTHIEKVLCELHGLRVLYLHGNNIYTLSEVDRLGVLPHLHTVTLHGNPIETNKAYRNCVISALPLLKTMDFSAVTQQERVLAKLWHQSNTRCRNSRKSLH